MNRHYYDQLSEALALAEVAQPTLVIDHDRLTANIRRLQAQLGEDYNYRIVAKSLPSLPLLNYVMNAVNSRRVMCFHLPFMIDVIRQTQDIDILIGKPFPRTALEHFYSWHEQHSSGFTPERQIQWLVDSKERLLAYEQLAKARDISMQVNLEIDIGLHRGGFAPDDEFVNCLKLIANSTQLRLSGLMGYDAHLAKMPTFFGIRKRAKVQVSDLYQDFYNLVEQHYPSHETPMCLNTAGSMTFSFHTCARDDLSTPANEISAASILVKPSDFDLAHLKEFEPAAFIATPVLKRLKKPCLPGPKTLSVAARSLGMLPKEAAFIYGGNWLADPVHPANSKRVSLFGHSSNQEMYSWPETGYDAADYLILRPRQTEAVLLQFGQLAIYKNSKIDRWWPTLNYPDSLYPDSLYPDSP